MRKFGKDLVNEIISGNKAVLHAQSGMDSFVFVRGMWEGLCSWPQRNLNLRQW